MMKLLPIILVLVGAGAGLGAGAFLGGNSKEDAEAMAKDGEMEGKDKVEPHLAEQPHDDGEPYDANVDYVRLNNQFVVPIVEDERVASLIVMSLALETEQGQTDLVFEREPKLRDEFLTVLFAHARSGGFAGSFTDEHLMDDLRGSLVEAARKVLGKTIRDVLLNDIVRQDL